MEILKWFAEELKTNPLIAILLMLIVAVVALAKEVRSLYMRQLEALFLREAQVVQELMKK
jgi:hypothetical protein